MSDLLDGGTPPESNTAPEGNNAPEGGAPPAPEFEVPEWAQGVELPDAPNDVRYDPSIKAFITDDKKLNLGNLLKSYVHAQKTMGKDKIVVPGEKADEQAWKEVFKKLGLPDAPDKYTVNLPEEKEAPLAEDFVNKFKEAAYDAGVLPRQAEKLLGFYQKQVKDSIAEMNSQKEASLDEIKQSLKQEFGEKYDYNISVAREALIHYGGPEMLEQAKQSGLANNPDFIKFLVKVSSTLSEDALKGIKNDGGIDNQSLSEEIESLQRHPGYLDPNHPEHTSIVNKVHKFYQKVYR